MGLIRCYPVLLTLRRESHLAVILRFPSHLLIAVNFEVVGDKELPSEPRYNCSVEVLADRWRYRFNLATRRFAVYGEVDGEGGAILADMFLESLLPLSVDLCRNDEWDLDLVGMSRIFRHELRRLMI